MCEIPKYITKEKYWNMFESYKYKYFKYIKEYCGWMYVTRGKNGVLNCYSI